MSDNPQEISSATSVHSGELVAAVSEKPGALHPPRLGIIHFLAWITVDALLLGISISTNRQACSQALEGSLSRFYLAASIAQIALQSAGIVGLVTLLRWKLRTPRTALAPGHWILAITGAHISILWALAGFWWLLAAGKFIEREDANLNRNSVMGSIIVLVLVSAFLFAALKCKTSRGWRRMFALLAFSLAILWPREGIYLLGDYYNLPWDVDFFDRLRWCNLAGGIGQGIAAIVLAVYAAFDFRKGQRDWLHALGILILIAGDLLDFATGLTWWLTFPKLL